MSLHISTTNDSELAEKAYQSVRAVPTVEPNDRNRLGYHVWLFLRGELPSLEEAVNVARARFSPKTLPPAEVVAHIEEQLKLLESGLVSIDTEGKLA